MSKIIQHRALGGHLSDAELGNYYGGEPAGTVTCVVSITLHKSGQVSIISVGDCSDVTVE